MRSTLTALVLVPVFLSLGTACNEVPADVPVGALSASLQLPAAPNDVTAVRIDIVAADAACDATPVASKTLTLGYPQPAGLAPAGAGSHAFVDGLFLLAAGAYRACAAPLAGEVTSRDCAAATALATVVAGDTRRVLLVSQCRGQVNGGLNVGVVLNSPPQITDLAISPSKFITVCQAAQIAVTASDPDGDALAYGFSIAEGPAGATVTGTGATASFSALVAGSYVVSLTVDDVLGGRASLTFPVHVADAACAPPAIQAIFSNSCSPCHTTGASGGLKLDTAEASFANLVGKGATGMGCMDRVRVIPGNAGGSYLMAKLRGLAGICGAPMPRGRPALPEADLQAIELWINGLPH